LLLICGFFLGIGLTSFSSAAPLASGWYPARSQGVAMGIFGMGNIGQSMAVLGAPLVAAAMGYRSGVFDAASLAGYRWGFWFFALLTFFWLLGFAALARDPRKPLGAPTKRPQLLPLLREGKVWILSCYYFLTFGGLVAMGVYLPTLLTDTHLFGLE